MHDTGRGAPRDQDRQPAELSHKSGLPLCSNRVSCDIRICMGRQRDDDRLTPRLVAVAAFGFLLLTPPLLSLFDHGAWTLGVPVVWAYLLLAWVAVIGLVAVTVLRSGRGSG